MEFVVGLVIGLAAGFLFAPKTGREFRKDLESVPDAARETAEEMRGKIEDAIKTGKEAAAKREEELKEEIEEEEKGSPPGYIV